MTGKIKAVLFDFDGVLLDTKRANTIFYQRLMKVTGYPRPSREETDIVFPMTFLGATGYLTKEKSKRKIMKIWNRWKKLDNLYPIKMVKVPRDAEETIQKLYKNYKVGMVTNRRKVDTEDLYRVSRLRGKFDVVVAFEDCKKPKPDPEPLLTALQRLRMKPSAVVYVGDSDVDVKAARAAGMRIIGYSKKKLLGADLSVSSFAAIPSAVKRLDS